MKFSEIVQGMKLTEARLATLIRAEESGRQNAELLRDTARLMDLAENFDPASMDELGDMVAFFIRRSSRNLGGTDKNRDLKIAVDLANRLGVSRLPGLSVATPAGGAQPNLVSSGLADPEELRDFVTNSRDRHVVVDRSGRYLAVSQANAKFHFSSPVSMLGLHIRDVIGHSRYHDRAAPELRRSFNGQRREYVYGLKDVWTGNRIIKCEMVPIRDRQDQQYCTLLQMTDITDGLSDDTSA